jgi:hypothetical protein
MLLLNEADSFSLNTRKQRFLFSGFQNSVAEFLQKSRETKYVAVVRKRQEIFEAVV